MTEKLRKKLLLAVLCICAVVLSAGGLSAPVNAQAASKITDLLSSSGKTVCDADLDGDGIEEHVELKISYDSEQAFFSKIRFYVNGEKALSCKSGYTNFIKADYVKMNDTQIFLRIFATTDNDCVVTDRIYRYDSSQKKLVEAARLLEDLCSIIHAQPKISQVTDSELKIAYQMQFPEIGRVKWNSSYIVKDGTLQLRTTTMKPKSCLGNITFNGDGYHRFFKKNKFQAARKLTLYRDTELNRVSFTADPGDVLRLTGMRYDDQSLYAKFSSKTKTGWMKLGQDDTGELFCGVAARLAG